MRISDWSSDVCSSDLASAARLASGMPSSHSGIQPKAALSARAAGSESMATTPRNSAPSSQVASGGMAELPALAVSRENDRLAFVLAALLESGVQRSEGHTS